MGRSPAPAIPVTNEPRHYTWHYVLALFAEHKRAIIGANLVAALAALLAVPVPLLVPLLVDEVLLGRGGPVVTAVDAVLPPDWRGAGAYILVVTLATIVLRAMSLALQVWQSRSFSLIAKDLIFRIRRELLERLRHVSMAEYEVLGASTVATHLVVDLNTIDEFTGVTLSQLVIAVLTLVGGAAVLLWMHWQLGLLILLLNPAAVYFTMRISRRVKELKRRENSALQVFQESLAETLDAIQQMRIANREGHYLGRVIERARDIRQHAATYAWKSDAAGRFSFAVFLVSIDVFRALAMLLVVFSDLSLGRMIAVFSYLWFLVGPIETVLNLQYALQGANAALERVNRVWRLAREPDFPTRHNPFRERAAVSVELDEVSFRYGDGPLVLDGLSLKVEAGEQVAIVGASGGGKSTLVQVLLGLYAPIAGRVLYDGIALDDIGFAPVREHVGVVLQHPAMLHASVRENLTLGRDADDARLWHLLAIAQLDQTVAALPQGLDTVIGRTGIRLSGGQRQRLAIARMLLTDPYVVILDEATSALDVVTEFRLHEALHRQLAGRTLIIIAHRLSAVRRASRVFVMEDGKVVEQGNHDELLAEEGLYARLYGRAQT
ncbi:MAG: ABC transporter ATP-binding protein [Proteobacteria bacterium]|nr:ABC transporter ATP-binding protein [Pseudomonadota bacterium]